jgi:CubicO group peptidase (beta-lactamase class C family)
MVDLEPTLKAQAIIEKYLGQLPETVQLAIALIQGDTSCFVGAVRTSEGFRYCDNRTAVFEIGSITKFFTATLLAYAVEDGVLQWDLPVQEYVPFKLKQSQRCGVDVTLRHLANHTSGMCHQPPHLFWYSLLQGHPREPFRNYSKERFEHYLRCQMGLAFAPGEKYRYSNMGMSLAGYILSLKANEEYEDLLQSRLFKPLGMDLSTTLVTKVRQHVVSGLDKARVRAPNWDMYALSPAGGIKTCAEDLAKFVRLQFSTEATITMTQAPSFKVEREYDNVYVGLGWHIIKRVDQEPLLFGGGGMLGYTAHVRVNVAKKCGSLVLSNLGNYHKWQTGINNLNRDLLDYLETMDVGYIKSG